MNKANNRFLAIDGMRGIAALGVVLYHLSGNLKSELAAIFPSFVNQIFSYGFLGVPVFFVISGMVISLSIGKNQITKNYAVNFIVRRSIRLDPTYWAAIFFGIALLLLKNKISAVQDPLPSVGNILAHMFYLQDILQVKPTISVVFWTLCLEVQFYLFYIFSLWVSQKVAFYSDRYFVHTLVVISLGVYSILLDRHILSIPVSGLFLSNWHYFLMGVLTANAIRRMPYSQTILLGWLTFEAFTCSYFEIKPYQLAGIFSSAFIYVLWKKDLIGAVFTSLPLQYLGKISYTLYLVHPDIGWKVISVGRTLLHGQLSTQTTLLLFIFSILVSILCAHIFHVIFERPSLWLSNQLKEKSFKEILPDIVSSIKSNPTK